MGSASVPAEGYRLKDGVVFRVIKDGEGCLLDVGQRAFYALNATGIFIVEQVQRGRGRDEIIAALCEEFETDTDACAADLDGFIAHLESAGVVSQTP